jgi:hypothetical protein
MRRLQFSAEWEVHVQVILLRKYGQGFGIYSVV